MWKISKTTQRENDSIAMRVATDTTQMHWCVKECL